jgi:MSHA biogenesis protein MshO
VVVIVVTGIIAVMVAVFIKAPVEGYFDTVRRAELTDAADTALRRVARDVRAALPNSLREDAAASDQCFEFLPIVAGGRYRAEVSSTGTGDFLDFTGVDPRDAATQTSFDVLGHVGLPQPAGTQLVIYNLGIPGADAYAGDNRAAIDTATTAKITLTAVKLFPFESPGKRFQVIENNAVVFACVGVGPGPAEGDGTGTLYRYTRAIASAKMAACPTSAPAGGTVLAGNVSACSLKYIPAVSQRNGLLSLTLALKRSGESAQLYQEVHVDNSP